MHLPHTTKNLTGTMKILQIHRCEHKGSKFPPPFQLPHLNLASASKFYILWPIIKI